MTSQKPVSYKNELRYTSIYSDFVESDLFENHLSAEDIIMRTNKLPIEIC